MNSLTKLCGALAVVFFLGCLVFTFLGLDSVEHPATMSLLTAGGICLAAGVSLFLIRLICLRRLQKTHK